MSPTASPLEFFVSGLSFIGLIVGFILFILSVGDYFHTMSHEYSDVPGVKTEALDQLVGEIQRLLRIATYGIIGVAAMMTPPTVAEGSPRDPTLLTVVFLYGFIHLIINELIDAGRKLWLRRRSTSQFSSVTSVCDETTYAHCPYAKAKRARQDKEAEQSNG